MSKLLRKGLMVQEEHENISRVQGHERQNKHSLRESGLKANRVCVRSPHIYRHNLNASHNPQGCEGPGESPDFCPHTGEIRTSHDAVSQQNSDRLGFCCNN